MYDVTDENADINNSVAMPIWVYATKYMIHTMTIYYVSHAPVMWHKKNYTDKITGPCLLTSLTYYLMFVNMLLQIPSGSPLSLTGAIS
jgi:hypothetical protein